MESSIRNVSHRPLEAPGVRIEDRRNDRIVHTSLVSTVFRKVWHALRSILPEPILESPSVTIRHVENDAQKTAGDSAAAGKQTPQTLTLHQLAESGLMLSGEAADKASGIVLSHIEVFAVIANTTNTPLSFRKVNPGSTPWIEAGSPVKDLFKKNKTQKGGALSGLMVINHVREDSSDSCTGNLPGEIYASLLVQQILNEEVEVIEPDEMEKEQNQEADTHIETITLRDRNQDGKKYLIKYDPTMNKFAVDRLFENGTRRPIKFDAKDKKPIVADYDAFDFYPHLSNFKQDTNVSQADVSAYSRVKTLDTRAAQNKEVGYELAEMSASENIRKVYKPVDMSAFHKAKSKKPNRKIGEVTKLEALVRIVQDQVLELPKVRYADRIRGRLTDWDNKIIDMANDAIKKKSGQPYDRLMHGKEKRNTQFPEQGGVFFIFPDGTRLMSNDWEQTQAVDYAIQQEGFISTTNRVYNQKAGEKALFPDQEERGEDGKFLFEKGSGKTIPWNSREAAEKLYKTARQSMEQDWPEATPTWSALNQHKENIPASSANKAATKRPPITRNESTATTSSMATQSSTASTIPVWLQKLVEGHDCDGTLEGVDIVNDTGSRMAGTEPAEVAQARSPKSVLSDPFDRWTLSPLTKINEQ